ncbi:MAG: F0F1 ATP synthase subunit B [Streptococcaceae bacterium]|jgi:F-type H+-transporting ATPase subunit b|nr:F0F1 ATP synthase subunit B [Streptococcaceae bacterium]
MLATQTLGVMFGNIIIASISLLLLLYLLKKFAWQSIMEIFKKRAQKIAADIDEAKKANLNAQKLEKKRKEQLANSQEEVTTILKTVKETGERNRQNILMATKEEVKKLKEKAKVDLEQERKEILINVKEEVADLSLQIAAKILNKELTKKTHKVLINSFIDKLGESYETR